MYLFSEDLLHLFDFLKLEKAGMSVKAFISALQFLSAGHGRHNVISQKIFHEAFREWRKCKYEVEQLEKKDAMYCPACTNDLHACHIDGNRKLYRFKNMAISAEENYFKNVFIADDKLVEEIIGKIQSSGVQEKSSYCGQTYWQAAKSRSKSFKNLEETGLVVGCCKHAVMLKALNMYQGEIYAYPLTLQWLISQDYSQIRYICQDVICKYFPWMMKVLDKPINIPGIETLRQCKPFLSVMHGKAHNWSCQIKWGGRWQPGSGSVTGEEMEQCNSYLSTAGLTTKNMSKAGREEEITMHALHWNTKKRDRLPERLAFSYAKTKKAMLEHKKELEVFCQENDVHEGHISSWEMSLREMAKDTPRQKSADLTDAEKFFLYSAINKDSLNINSFIEEADPVCGLLTGSRELQRAASDFRRKENLKELDELRSRMCINGVTDDYMYNEGKVSMAKKRVVELEKLIETSYSSIKYREVEVSKIADTSKVRHRIRKKLGEEKKQLQELVEEYNLIVPVVNSDFVALSEIDAQEGNWPWITVIGHDNIPTRVKRKIVEKNLEFIRLGEEEDLIADEMKSVLNYFEVRGDFLKQKRACLVWKLENSDFNLSDIYKDSATEGRYTFSKSPDYPVIGGCLALVERQYFLNKRRIDHCCDLFSSILNDLCVRDEVLNDYEEEVLDVEESEILENLDDFTLEEIDEINL